MANENIAPTTGVEKEYYRIEGYKLEIEKNMIRINYETIPLASGFTLTINKEKKYAFLRTYQYGRNVLGFDAYLENNDIL